MSVSAESWDENASVSTLGTEGSPGKGPQQGERTLKDILGKAKAMTKPPKNETHAQMMDRKRKERIEAHRKEQDRKEKERLAKEWEEKWGWIQDGKRQYQKFQQPWKMVTKVLGPHRGKKLLNAEFLEAVSQLREDDRNLVRYATSSWKYDPHSVGHWRREEVPIEERVSYKPHARTFGHRLNRKLNEGKDIKFHKSKSLLIAYYWRVLKQINPNCKAEYKAHAFVEARLFKSIRVVPRDLMNLKMTQHKHEQAILKLDEICAAIARNNTVATCRSPQHTKPAGCPICGANVTKAGLMVHSVDRKTGVATLVPLETELETLHREESDQSDLIDEVGSDLNLLNQSLADKVSRHLQNWWCRKIARRRSEKKEDKIDLSLWNFRNRRLVLMMKMINAKKYTTGEIEEEFPDLHSELHEHFNVVTIRHNEMISRVSKDFLQKLRNAVILARRKRFKHEEQMNEEKNKRLEARAEETKGRDIEKMRIRVRMLESTRWRCMRAGCDMREFLTVDRYNTHLRFHRMDDERKHQTWAINALKKKFRGCIEDKIIERVRTARVLTPQGPPALNRSSSDGDALLCAPINGDEKLQDGSLPPLVASINETDKNESLKLGTHDSTIVNTTVNTDSFVDANNSESIDEGDVSCVNNRGSAEDETGQQQQHQQQVTELLLQEKKDSANQEEEDKLKRELEIEKMLQELDRLNAYKYNRKDTELLLRRENLPERIKNRKQDFLSLTMANQNPGFHYSINGLNADFVATAPAKNLLLKIPKAPEKTEYNLDELKPIEWSATPHIWTVNSFLNHHVYHLELLSKHGDVEVPSKVTLDKPTIRIGSLPYCEVHAKCKGAVKRDRMISQIHTVITVPVSLAEDFRITVLDNTSLWGTYVVNKSGGKKVPSKLTLGMRVEPGDLLCIGVVREGPPELDAKDAGRAACVYRVRCFDIENKEV